MIIFRDEPNKPPVGIHKGFYYEMTISDLTVNGIDVSSDTFELTITDTAETSAAFETEYDTVNNTATLFLSVTKVNTLTAGKATGQLIVNIDGKERFIDNVTFYIYED